MPMEQSDNEITVKEMTEILDKWSVSDLRRLVLRVNAEPYISTQSNTKDLVTDLVGWSTRLNGCGLRRLYEEASAMMAGLNTVSSTSHQNMNQPSIVANSVARAVEQAVEQAPLLDSQQPVAQKSTTLPNVQPPTPTTVKTSRRNFLWAIPVIGATSCGLYALNHNGKSAIQTNTPPKIGTTKVNPIDGAEMTWIPASSFDMGGTDQQDGQPIHTVPLSGYWIYTAPVTVAQFQKYDDANGNKYDWEGRKDWHWKPDHPMVNVTWDEASDYAKWAGVSLPTEAQWEKAARGGLEGKEYPWGDGWDGSKCANSVTPFILQGTRPIKSYAMNGYGLYDMAGNVNQWCVDWYDMNYYQTAAATLQNPTGATTGTSNVLRGGSWDYTDRFRFRCAYRDGDPPDTRTNTIGFRCVAAELSR